MKLLTEGAEAVLDQLEGAVSLYPMKPALKFLCKENLLQVLLSRLFKWMETGKFYETGKCWLK